MTPLSIIYFAIGILSLLWPILILLFKRRVLEAQWLMSTALLLFGLSVILYSTFFNSFLKGEYLLVILYMVLSLSVLPVTQAAVAIYTRPQGVPFTSRILVIPSLLTVLLMILSVAIGGADMYRLWIANGANTIAGQFFHASWRYNLIVAVHYYLYWFILVGEILYMLFYILSSLRRFRLVLNEYYTASQHNRSNIRGLFLTVGINSLCVLLNYLFFPFNRPRPLGTTLAISLIQATSILLAGLYLYRINYGAEQLGEKLRANRFGRSNLRSLWQQIALHLERDKAALNPDISVFLLSEKFKVSQDDIVDAIHRFHGTPFGDYVNSLRIEHATSIILSNPTFNHHDPEHLARLAHQCGYLSAEALQEAFSRVMQMSLQEWRRS